MTAVFLMNALFFLSMAGALLVSWRMTRPMPGPMEWAIASVVFAFAFSQVAISMPLVNVYARISNNLCWITGAMLVFNGARRFFGLQPKWWPAVVVIVVQMFAVLWAVVIMQSQQLRVIVASTGGIIVILAIVWQLSRPTAVRGPGLQFAIGSFSLLIVLLLVRLHFFIFRGEPDGQYLDYILAFAAMPACLLAGLLGLLLMTIERLVRELRDAGARVAEASHAKTEFLMSMSHELRTPLNAILGFNQLLTLDPQPLSPRQLDYIRHIEDGGRQLLRLIDDTSDVGRIETGAVAFTLEPLDAADLLNRAAEAMTPTAAANGVVVSVEATALRVLADRGRLRQVVGNLVSNAVKYNRPGGTVRLGARPISATTIRIEVTDTGRGIPFARRAEVFQRFQRLGAERTTIQGMGIGLNIARQLVEAMGGQMGFESTEGVGSLFWVDLPVAPAG